MKIKKFEDATKLVVAAGAIMAGVLKLAKVLAGKATD